LKKERIDAMLRVTVAADFPCEDMYATYSSIFFRLTSDGSVIP
jgi:hypothetical protein